MSAVDQRLAKIAAVFGASLDELLDAAAVKELFRTAFAGMEKMQPGEVDEIVLAVIGHLRQLRPEQFGCLSKLPPPGPIKDPRANG